MTHKKKLTDDDLSAILLAELGPLFDDSGVQLKTPLDDLTKALGLREVTTAELAEVLGVCPQRITQLWMSGDIPEPHMDGKRNLFPLLSSVRGYIDFLRDR